MHIAIRALVLTFLFLNVTVKIASKRNFFEARLVNLLDAVKRVKIDLKQPPIYDLVVVFMVEVSMIEGNESHALVESKELDTFIRVV